MKCFQALVLGCETTITGCVDDQNDFVQAYSGALAAHPEAKVHTYGKSARAGRKMGHVTVVADSAEHALAEAQGASAVLLRG